jgi:hypothetical protein
MKNNTFVISAFPACGKSYCFENYQSEFSMLDSDSSDFSWIKDSDGNNTKERNPEFPDNYIKHIKENIGKVDIIFVSSNKEVRQALVKNGIKYVSVCPDKAFKIEWIKRCIKRGNDEDFVEHLLDNWDEFVDGMINDGGSVTNMILCQGNSYIDMDLLNDLEDHDDAILEANTCKLWSNTIENNNVTLEHYIRSNFQKGIIDHNLRAYEFLKIFLLLVLMISCIAHFPG